MKRIGFILSIQQPSLRFGGFEGGLSEFALFPGGGRCRRPRRISSPVPVKNKINSATHRSSWNKLAKIASSGDFPSISQVWKCNDRVKKNELLQNYVLSERNAEKVERELWLRAQGEPVVRRFVNALQYADDEETVLLPQGKV